MINWFKRLLERKVTIDPVYHMQERNFYAMTLEGLKPITETKTCFMSCKLPTPHDGPCSVQPQAGADYGRHKRWEAENGANVEHAVEDAVAKAYSPAHDFDMDGK